MNKVTIDSRAELISVHVNQVLNELVKERNNFSYKEFLDKLIERKCIYTSLIATTILFKKNENFKIIGRLGERKNSASLFKWNQKPIHVSIFKTMLREHAEYQSNRNLKKKKDLNTKNQSSSRTEELSPIDNRTPLMFYTDEDLVRELRRREIVIVATKHL